MALSKKQTEAFKALSAAIAVSAEGFVYAPFADLKQFIAEGLVEINDTIKDENGNVAVRLISKSEGTEKMTEAVISAASSAFVIEDGISIPSGTRRGRTQAVYPFDALGVGQSFFVPNDDEKPNAAKSLASTVSSATARYMVEAKDESGNVVTETVTVKTYETDEFGKRVKRDGHYVEVGVETVTRPVLTETRKFVVRAVDGGARIWRTK